MCQICSSSRRYTYNTGLHAPCSGTLPWHKKIGSAFQDHEGKIGVNTSSQSGLEFIEFVVSNSTKLKHFKFSTSNIKIRNLMSLFSFVLG